MTFGEKVKQIMKEKGIRQNELARKVNMSSSGMSTALSKDGNPREYTVRAIAAALGVTVGDLMDDDIKKEQEILVDPLRESIIRDYDQLPPEAQRLVRQYIDLLSKR